jgi:hypothetical protein
VPDSSTQTVVKNMADGIIAIEDGSRPANAVQLVVDEGDMSFDVAQRESVAVMDRTDLSSLRPGKARPCSGRFQVKFKEFLSAAGRPVTPHEALFGVGAASSWLSTNSDGGGVRAVRIRFTCVSPITGEQAEDIVFEKCYELNETFSEKADADLLAVSFKDFEERPTVAKRTPANPTDEPTFQVTTAA